MTNDLDTHLSEIASAPVLLVATDFDGTVAPIVARPELVDPNREAIVALRRLSEMPNTHVAVISGRALSDLALRLGTISDARLVGSHGSEFEAGFVESLTDDQKQRLDAACVALEGIAAKYPGSHVECKPASVAFHYREVDPGRVDEVIAEVDGCAAASSGLHAKRGKMVIEYGALPLDKGLALEHLRSRIGATAVIYFGDDVTDEDAFAKLRGPDLGVKVGPGDSLAAYRVDDPAEVSRRLAQIAEMRQAWHSGTSDVPIEEHSLLSDQRTIALVAPNGRIPWLCLPRIDSAAIFSELLGGPAAGYFEVRSSSSSRALGQSYLDDSLVLETRWPGFRVIDYLDAAGGRAYQRAGRASLFRVIEGSGRVVVTFAPRLDFGRGETHLRLVDGGVHVEGSIDAIVLLARGVRFEIVAEGTHPVARAEFDLTGEPVVLELRYGTANVDASQLPERSRREQNIRFWQGWSSTLELPSRHKEAVKRSALVLKALTYGPTGAIAAAGTTSLPESFGGCRNWDYRFCWPRDAAVSAHALALLGATGAGQKLIDWLLSILESAGHGAMIAPVYTVSGAHLPPEAELPHLPGYGGSRPVRISNAAAHQIQLDVFGPICALVAELAARECPLSGEHLRFLDSIVATIAQRWSEPDHGIWEIRLPRRHHVHSKVMCWQAVDRAIAASRYLGRPRTEWVGLRDSIRDEVLREGRAAGAAHFGTAYGLADPDAAALWVGLSGMMGFEDPAVSATIEIVERELQRSGGIYRYVFDDGLPGKEGVFNVCTSWFIESLAASGRRVEAEPLLERYVRLAGNTGSMAEEFDPDSGRALGNVPQAYTHAGLISASVCLDRADRR